MDQQPRTPAIRKHGTSLFKYALQYTENQVSRRSTCAAGAFVDDHIVMGQPKASSDLIAQLSSRIQ